MRGRGESQSEMEDFKEELPIMIVDVNKQTADKIARIDQGIDEKVSVLIDK